MNIMKFFGFENDDEDYDDNDDYTEDRRSDKRSSSIGRRNNSSRSGSGSSNASGKIIIYYGIAHDQDKKRLCEAFNNGSMILLDMHNLNQREFEEEGKDFITFMGGVAFARSGDIKFLEPAQYLLTPRTNMYEIWPEEGEIDE